MSDIAEFLRLLAFKQGRRKLRLSFEGSIPAVDTSQLYHFKVGLRILTGALLSSEHKKSVALSGCPSLRFVSLVPSL